MISESQSLKPEATFKSCAGDQYWRKHVFTWNQWLFADCLLKRTRAYKTIFFLCEYIVFFSVQSPVSQSSLHISAPLWLHFSFYSYVLLNKKHSYRTPYFIWKVSVYLVFLFLGGRGDNGSPIIVFPEFPAFGEITDKEFHNVLTYLTSVPR